jgi:hypothetical protein
MTKGKYHYNTSYQFINYGDKILEHFWDFVEVDQELGCWIWKGARRTNGIHGTYGGFWFENKLVLAHRFSYEVNKGKIAKGLELDHSCKNTLCVNPNHLEAITHEENCDRGNSMTKNFVTHCIRGHRFTEDYKISKNRRGRQCKICKNLRDSKAKRLKYDKDPEYRLMIVKRNRINKLMMKIRWGFKALGV